MRPVVYLLFGLLIGVGGYRLASVEGSAERADRRPFDSRILSAPADTSPAFAPGAREDGTSAFDELAALYAWAATMDADAAAAEVAAILDEPPASQRDRRLTVLMSRLLSLEPTAAAAKLSELNNSVSQLQPVFEDWARAQPERALRLLPGIPDARMASTVAVTLVEGGGYSQEAYATVESALPPSIEVTEFWLSALRSHVRSDPDRALAVATGISDARLRHKALRTVASGWPLDRLEDATRLSPAIDDPRLARMFRFALLDRLAKDDPERAIQYVANAGRGEFENWNALQAAIGELAQENPTRALEMAEEIPRPFGDALRQAALSNWADEDPLGALAYVEALPVSRQQQSFRQAVAAGYAMADFDAAWAWAQNLQPSSDDVVAAVLAARARTAPADALRRVDALPREARTQALQNIVITTATTGDPAEIARSLVAISDGPAKEQAIALLGQFWAQTNPTAAVDWFIEQGANLAPSAFNQIGQQLGQVDPQAAKQMTSRIPASAREAWVTGVASGYSATDPDGALQWVSAFEGQPGYDAAVSQLIPYLVKKDPVAAGRLIGSIETPAYRANATITTASQWATQDPATAARWSEAIAEEATRSSAVGQVGQVWSWSDPASATTWALGLPQGVVRDAAVVGVLQGTARNGQPDLALLDSIGSEKLRQQAVQSIAFSVMRTDPDAARALIDEHIGDPQLREQLKQMLTRNAGSFGMATRSIMSP